MRRMIRDIEAVDAISGEFEAAATKLLADRDEAQRGPASFAPRPHLASRAENYATSMSGRASAEISLRWKSSRQPRAPASKRLESLVKKIRVRKSNIYPVPERRSCSITAAMRASSAMSYADRSCARRWTKSTLPSTRYAARRALRSFR